jgi:hypothetical protein
MTTADKNADPSLPPYAFVPGGPWPHPRSSPEGHSYGRVEPPAAPIAAGGWADSPAYRTGLALFNAGYYWEAHEVWESLWHAHGRHGPVADILKGLIKLAAAGVKVRERQRHGVTIHAHRAADLFRSTRLASGPIGLGLDLAACESFAREIAAVPPADPAPEGARVSVVFPFRLEPR